MGDKITAKETAKTPAFPSCRARTAASRDDDEAMADRQAHRLSGADQGRRRRRRSRHEGRASDREDLSSGARDGARRGQGRLRRRRGLHREISDEAAPHRDPGPRRRPGQRDPSRASATARCSGATRRSGRKRPRPPSTRRAARSIGETVAERHAEARLSRRRHGRVSLRGWRVLLHRDEHAPAGRASGDGDDHRHRSRAASRSASPPAPICR